MTEYYNYLKEVRYDEGKDAEVSLLIFSSGSFKVTHYMTSSSGGVLCESITAVPVLVANVADCNTVCKLVTIVKNYFTDYLV